MLRHLIPFLLPAAFLGCSSSDAVKNDPFVQDTVTAPASDTSADLSSLNTRIRDGKISKEEAVKLLRKFIPIINAYYYAQGGKDHGKEEWVFPLQGYTSSSIGGKNGSGYVADGYNYFDGNDHKGHPAHDIFIHDNNQDCRDDACRHPVNVLSMTGGIVIATETAWDTGSVQRGGNYIWIYDPGMKSLFYYAHNSTVKVKTGVLVKPGDVIATVGRTGFNAYKKRSPTHLHLMQLTFGEDLLPHPVNPYQDLLKAQVHN